MGCERSKLNPHICLSEEAAWLEKMRQQCVDISRNSKTSNVNVGLFNYNSTVNDMSNSQRTCHCNRDWKSEIPEIILLIVVLLFVYYLYRKYKEHKKRINIRKEVIGMSQTDRARLVTVQMIQSQGNAIDWKAYES